MRSLPSNLTAKLESGVTTLARCWRLTRRDGVVLGFTDHDRDITFEGTTFEAGSGLSASEITASVGLSVDNLEVDGALSSDRLAEADLAAGVYDDAAIEIFVVDWAAPEDRFLERAGSIGEVSRGGGAFRAEVRGLAHYLQQPTGRLFQYTCDADLGDGRCRVDLDDPAFRGEAVVVEVRSERAVVVSGLAGFADGWFRQGLAAFTSGAAAGQKVEIKAHAKAGIDDLIEMWAPVRWPLEPGQTLVVTAGCDKLLATCRDRFANAINFQGFPFMPGNDFVTRVARANS